MIFSGDEATRKSAWQGINEAWTAHQDTAAAILNSLADWRLQVVTKRSHAQHVNFLTEPLFQNRIKKETLLAMMQAVENNKSSIQEAVLMMAKYHGKAKLDPWDLNAPAPAKTMVKPVEFSTALELIRKAFNNADPQFGEFVSMMEKNNWIEARVLPNKASGAHCTGFAKSRTPLVFQSYLGSKKDITTLAHELGHAYHSWVLRDLSLDQLIYPKTLAETASIFAETLLAEELMAAAITNDEKISCGWSDLEQAVGLLLNIPARFEFENNFYKLRKEKLLSPRELSDLTDQAWSKWYGNTLSENTKMFWATKMHFSFADESFYNFPYTFGYLFGLSIYARRKQLGKDFWPTYTAILRDTGQMTAEDLIQKHLGENIQSTEFWQKSIDVVIAKINNFKKLL